MNWWVIVNPAAGKRREDAHARTRRIMAEHGEGAHIRVTESEIDVARAVDEGVTDGRTHFVVAGGDGTINLTVDALLRHTWETPPTLAILPAGTGSDFIRTFGIPQDMDKAADHLQGTDTYLADAGVVEGEWGDRYFLNEAQAGVGAHAARNAGRFAFLGTGRYTAAFWTGLPRFPVADVAVTVGERGYEGPALDVVAANGQFFAGGMNIAPKATVVDGEADVQVFAVSRKRQAFSIFPRVMKGMHLSHPQVRRLTGPEFQIDTDPLWPVEVDGEYLGSTPLRGRILRGALQIKI